MGELLHLRRDHEKLGVLALEALAQGNVDHAIRCLTTAWLDSSEDRAEAWPIAQQINALAGNLNGRGGAA